MLKMSADPTFLAGYDFHEENWINAARTYVNLTAFSRNLDRVVYE